MHKKVSLIIPAYNEDKRLAAVLQAACQSQYLDEIIVVDDGSVDQTAVVARSYEGVRVISQKNQGKHSAVLTGVKACQGEILLFLDADLQGLKPSVIDRLVIPIRQGQADMSVVYRRGQHPLVKYLYPIEPMLAGERCLLKKDFWSIPGISKIRGFEFEMLVNRYMLDHRHKIKIIKASGLYSVLKYNKGHGLFLGIIADLQMAWRLVMTFGLLEVLRQMIQISWRFQFERRFFSKII